MDLVLRDIVDSVSINMSLTHSFVVVFYQSMWRILILVNLSRLTWEADSCMLVPFCGSQDHSHVVPASNALQVLGIG
jgi:hypothetical protein